MRVIARRCVAMLATGLLVACGSDAPQGEPPLFPGVPTFAMVAEDFSAIDLVGPIPPPRFSRLSYLQEIETPSNTVPVEQLIELTTNQGHRAGLTRLRSEFTFADSNDHALEASLQIGDLLEVFDLAYDPTARPGVEGSPAADATVTRSYIVAIEQVFGQLFPAKVGNRLEFEVTRYFQTERKGVNSRVQTLDFAYDMEIVRRSAPGNYPDIGLTEPVWVIQIRQVDPDGVERRREVHFSPEVGMPVFDATRRGRVITRRRLVSWENAS